MDKKTMSVLAAILALGSMGGYKVVQALGNEQWVPRAVFEKHEGRDTENAGAILTELRAQHEESNNRWTYLCGEKAKGQFDVWKMCMKVGKE